METNANSDDERRRFVRYVLKTSAKLAFDDGESVLGKVENVSTGGVFLQLDSPCTEMKLERKGHISINAIVPDKIISIEADCRVVRITSNGIGIFFESLDTANKETLFDLMDELNRLIRESRTVGDT